MVSSSSTVSFGLTPRTRAATPVTCGAAMEVPDWIFIDCLVHPERMFTPGAAMSGLARSVYFDGPRSENFATTSSDRSAPTAKASGKEPGWVIEPGPPGLFPSTLPAEKTGRMPALRHCLRASWKRRLVAELPHELLTTRGASSGCLTP